jgi:flagellar biosynthesis protein FlhG
MGTPPDDDPDAEGEAPAEVPIYGNADADADAAESPGAAAEGTEPRSRAHVLAFAAGRGGTGRSLLAANVAVYLAQTGKKVVAVDTDPAGGSLHLLLGTPRPPRGFGEFLRGRVEGLTELIVDTPVAGVGLIGGEGSAFGSTRPKQSAKGILTALAQLEVDYVVLDLGPPDSTLVLDLWLAADVPILVTLPDPASIEATYRFVKSAFLRRLRTTRGLDRLITNPQGPPRAALDLYRAARDGAGPVERLEQEIRRYRPRFIVNQTRTLPDLKLGAWMSAAARRRLGHTFEYLGHVESDETVWLAARRRRPLMAEYPEAKVAKNIERIARRLLSGEGERDRDRAVPTGPLRLEEEQTYYEILETEPGVSDEEVRRAFRALKEIYGASSPVVAGLYDEQELADLHARANAAHDTLFAPERRRLYDLALPEADLARAVRAAAANSTRRPDLDGPATPVDDRHDSTEIEMGEDVSGAVLRKIREARGIELGDIAQRTKISERHLLAIEEERFSDMPAAVYVRGYVMEYARSIRIDPQRAVESYLRRFHAKGAETAESGLPREPP